MSGEILSKRNYRDNLKHGLREDFFSENGSLRLRGQYNNDELYGQYLEWNIKGELILDCKIKKIKQSNAQLKK